MCKINSTSALLAQDATFGYFCILGTTRDKNYFIFYSMDKSNISYILSDMTIRLYICTAQQLCIIYLSISHDLIIYFIYQVDYLFIYQQLCVCNDSIGICNSIGRCTDANIFIVCSIKYSCQLIALFYACIMYVAFPAYSGVWSRCAVAWV